LVKDAPTGRTSARLPPRFDTITYRELWARVSAIASAWRRHPDHPVHPGDSAPPIDKYVTDLEHLGLL